jgi:hypothetical protein
MICYAGCRQGRFQHYHGSLHSCVCHWHCGAGDIAHSKSAKTEGE